MCQFNISDLKRKANGSIAMFILIAFGNEYLNIWSSLVASSIWWLYALMLMISIIRRQRLPSHFSVLFANLFFMKVLFANLAI